MTSYTGKKYKVTLNVPMKTIPGTITQTRDYADWVHPNGDDPWVSGTGSSRRHQWEITVTIDSQSHGSHLTREPFQYNGNDIVVGDWVADRSSGLALKVISVLSKSATEVKIIAEDYLRYNTFQSNNGFGGFDGWYVVFFGLNQQGKPLIQGSDSYSKTFWANISSRFEYVNSGDHYVLTQPGHAFQPNDVVAVTDQGFVRASADTMSKTVGSVSNVGPGPDQFIIEPYQDIIDHEPDIPGSQGDIVYLSTTGGLTVDPEYATDKAIYVIVSDRVPSESVGSAIDPVVSGGTSFRLNDATVTVPAPGDIDAMVSAVNLLTDQTHVTASKAGSATVVGNHSNTAYGLVGGYVPFSAYIDTGSANVLVTFTTDATGQSTYGMAVGLPADMATDINAANIPGIQASESGGKLIITEINGNSVTITNHENDPNGNGFAGDGGVGGVDAFTAGSTGYRLKLVESRGGPINIYDEYRSFVNSVQINSSHTGRPATAMLIEQGIRTAGISVVADLAARNNLNAGLGDQAYVMDKGDGEWGLYLHDGSQWIQLSDHDSSTVDARTLINNYDVELHGANTTISLGSMSAGTKVTSVGIEVTQEFNSTTPSEIVIQTLGAETVLVGPEDSDLNVKGRYMSTPNFVNTNQDSQEIMLVAVITPHDATQGSVTVRLTYS